MIINDIFKEYWAKKKTEFTISQLKTDLGEWTDKIVLYGAGSAGIAFLSYLRDIGIYPKCFADGNPSKWGTSCENLSVIDYRDIIKIAGENALVVITINTDGSKYCKSFDEALRVGGHSGVYKKLKESGCKHIIDYTYFRRYRDLFRGDKYNLPSCSDVRLIEEHEEDLCEAYNYLADAKSKEVFEKIVRFRMLDDSIKIPTENQAKQYFEYKFFQKRTDETFVDCGAYNGNSLNVFLQENNYQFRKYYGIEPDRENFLNLEEFVKALKKEVRDKITLVNTAVYDEQKKLKLYNLKGPGSFIADIGTQEIDTVTIDQLVDYDEITYIKMNIEGSELPALRGAQQTIMRCKPRLAIAGYHKTWDLWEIPKLICSINKSYKLYLRSYMNHISFVYYGV